MKISRLPEVRMREIGGDLLPVSVIVCASLIACSPVAWAQRLVDARASAAQAASAAAKPEVTVPVSSGPEADRVPEAPGAGPASADPPEIQAGVHVRAGGRGIRNGMRDPFRPPELRRRSVAATKVPNAGPAPPGIRGLKVDQLRLQGIIQEPSTHSMIAMVTNGGHLAYFLRPSDRLSDGTVSRITPGAIYLLRNSYSDGTRRTGEVVLPLEPGQGDSR